MGVTIGDGIIAFSVAFAIAGIFFALAWSPSTERGNYEICLGKCPSSFSGQFKDLECPRMCAELIKEDVQTMNFSYTYHKSNILNNKTERKNEK